MEFDIKVVSSFVHSFYFKNFGAFFPNVKRILFCTGKIYYDLDDYRILNKINNVAIVRIEQLYPFPLNQVNKLFEKYSKATEFTWVQEEPENMGAWQFVEHLLVARLVHNVVEVGNRYRLVAARQVVCQAVGCSPSL